MTASVSVKFVHRKHPNQTYWVGERFVQMAGKKVAQPLKINFEEGHFQTADDELVQFLRNHKDFNVLVFEDVTEGDLVEVEDIQDAVTKMKKKKKKDQSLAEAVR